jgi:cytochrome c
MSDLTFNKVAGAVLATGLAIFGLRELSSGIFSDEKVEKPGYAVEVAADTSGGEAAAADVPPDWGTVLPKADVAAGQAVFAKCQSCHSLTANGTGPDLMGVVGRKPGSEAGFSYSPVMEGFAAKQPIWDYQHLYEFIKNPQAYLPGSKMTFVGLKKPEDRINIIAYLHTQGSTLPIPAPNPAAAAKAASAGTTAATAVAAVGAPAPAPGAAAKGQPTATGSTATPAAGAGGPAGAGPGAPAQKVETTSGSEKSKP